MPIFKYKAIDNTGAAVESMQNAASREQMIEIIRSRSSIPVYIEEYSEKKDISFDFFKPKVKIRDIAVFCRQFYTMLHTGIPIVSCMDVLREQSENKRLKEAINTLYEDVQTGIALSESLRKHPKVFPELFINMVEAGEVSGNLDAIVHRMAVHYDKEAKLNAKIGNAMIYPIILMIAVVAVVVGLLTFIMPMFIGMFLDSGVALPLPTRLLVALSDSLIAYWYVYIAAIFIFSYFFYRFSRTDAGAFLIDGIKLKLPFFGTPINKIVTSRFTRTLSTLMSSGIPLMQSLEITSKIVGNRVVEEKLINARDQVRRGVELSVPIRESGVFAPMVYSMIMVGEESGMLDDTLEKTADFYDSEVEVAMQTVVAMMEPIMIAVMALVVGFIVISIFLPMLDMMQTVR